MVAVVVVVLELAATEGVMMLAALAPQQQLRGRGHIIGHTRNNMQVNISHAWL